MSNNNYNNRTTVWERVLTTLLKMPGIKVEREHYLRSALQHYCAPPIIERAIATSPVEVLGVEGVERLAQSCIRTHTLQVTAISTATGLPGGWAQAAALPADTLQYLYHVCKVSQKLAYLYGFPDLCDTQGNLTPQATNVLTVFTGVMMGISVATAALKELCEHITLQAFKRLPTLAVTPGTLIYQLVRNLGWQITRERATRSVTRAVPLVGGVVSGALTYRAFRPSARRLQRHLREQMPPLLEARRSMPTTPPPFKQGV